MIEIDPALARKRRKEIMQSLRTGETDHHNNVPVEAAASTDREQEDPQSEEVLPPKKRKVSENSDAAAESDPQRNSADDDKSVDDPDGPPGSRTIMQNGKKTQIRYDPDVPMSKEQLAAWRREARRVRNRESAAASRQRIRDRIGELEDEVGEWKSKYTEAMERLLHVQQVKASQQSH